MIVSAAGDVPKTVSPIPQSSGSNCRECQFGPGSDPSSRYRQLMDVSRAASGGPVIEIITGSEVLMVPLSSVARAVTRRYPSKNGALVHTTVYGSVAASPILFPSQKN